MTAPTATTTDGTLYVGDRLERFIPVAKREVLDDLLAGGALTGDERELFERFATILGALYHFYFHRDLEELKSSYLSFSPDSDTVSKKEYEPAELFAKRKEFLAAMERLLDDANYEPLGEKEINEALESDSPYGLSLFVDLTDFDEMLLHYRGSAVKVEERRTWKKLWLGFARKEIPVYKRLALVLKLKPESDLKEEIKERLGLDEVKAGKFVRRRRGGVTRAMREEAIYLKLFRDIPRSDLEMLFPNTQVRMNLTDKVKLGITGGGATIFGLVKTAGVVAGALGNPLTAVPALAGLVGLVARQVAKIFNLRTKYMVTLSQNLYFHNLDNNAGVFTHLVDLAEEEECKEAILAYYFLHTERDRRFTQEALDRRIESWIEERYGLRLDFEVEDGLAKLRRAGILVEEADGTLGVLDPVAACTRMDEEWDGFFEFHNAPTTSLPRPEAARPRVEVQPSVASFGSSESTITRREELPPEVLARLRAGKSPFPSPAEAEADVLDQVHGLPQESPPGDGDAVESATPPPVPEEVIRGPATPPSSLRGVGADEATMALPAFSREMLQEQISAPAHPSDVDGNGHDAARDGNGDTGESEDEGRVARCDGCGAKFKADKFESGVRFRCKKCKTVVVVP